MLDPQFDNICVIQNFVMVADDGTPWPKLPIGLKVDPRTDCILLNGRAGQLQFYSPYDGTFFSVSTKHNPHQSRQLLGHLLFLQETRSKKFIFVKLDFSYKITKCFGS